MKLLLSRSEATQLIREKLGLAENVGIEIVDNTVQTIDTNLRELVTAIDSMLSAPANFIGAVKHWRAQTGHGLWASKNIVERWNGAGGAREFIIQRGRIPVARGNVNDGFGGME